MKAIFREIFVQLIFVLLAQLVCNASLDRNSFWLAENARKFMMENAVTDSYFYGQAYVMTNKKVELLEREIRKVVPDAPTIEDRLHWMDWIRYSVTEYLFPPYWYNGKEFDKNFVADNAQSKVLAMARIRQLRIKPRTCVKHPVFQNLIVECNGPFSTTNEQKSDYSVGWKPPLNKTARYRLRRNKKTSLWKGLEDPWLHQDGADIQAIPYQGRFATYSGDSYAVSIGPRKQIAKKILQNMRAKFWIDRYTRGLLTEVNIYNANTNLLLIVKIVHEIIPTGGWNYWYDIQSLKLYRYVGGMGDIVILFDLIFIIATIVGWYKVLKALRRDGLRDYLLNVWHILHLFITVCSTLSIILFMVRLLLVKKQVQIYNENPDRFTSFAVVGQVEYIIMACMGIVAFMSTLEFLRILRFNKLIGQLLQTLSILTPPLASWLVSFFCLFLAYSSFAHCLFVDKLLGYRNFKYSIITLTLMFMGQFDLSELLWNAPVFGAIYFLTYMIVVTMIMINLFVGIICDGLAGIAEQDEDHDENEFLPSLLKAVQNVKAKKGLFDVPKYKESNDWEKMMKRVEEKASDCQYLIYTMEMEDIRQQQWLQTNHNNHKTWCIIAAVCGLDVMEYEEELYNGFPEMSRYLKTLSALKAQQFLYGAALLRKSGNVINSFTRIIENDQSDVEDTYTTEISDYESDRLTCSSSDHHGTMISSSDHPNASRNVAAHESPNFANREEEVYLKLADVPDTFTDSEDDHFNAIKGNARESTDDQGKSIDEDGDAVEREVKSSKSKTESESRDIKVRHTMTRTYTEETNSDESVEYFEGRFRKLESALTPTSLGDRSFTSDVVDRVDDSNIGTQHCSHGSTDESKEEPRDEVKSWLTFTEHYMQSLRNKKALPSISSTAAPPQSSGYSSSGSLKTPTPKQEEEDED